MARNDNELLIVISGTAKDFEKELQRVKKQTKSLEKGLTKAAKTSAAAFVVLTGSIAATVAKYAAFEKTFTNVVTLLDQSSFKTKTLTKGIDSLKDGIFRLRAETGESFETLNKGLFDLVSAGVEADKAIETLEASTKLAAAGATDTATATKALTSAITSFGEEAGDADAIAAKFFTAQKFAVSTVGELAQEFNKVAGQAKALGLSFDETLSAASAMTANGAKPAAIAFTEFRAVLTGVLQAQTKLSEFSPEVEKALSLQNIKQVGVVAALQQTKEALGGNVVAMQELFPNVRAFNAFLSLTGAQSKVVAKTMRAMSNEYELNGTFTEALRVKTETTDKAFKRLTGSLDVLITKIGEGFAPGATRAANLMAELAKNASEMDDSTRGLIVTLTKVGAVLFGLVSTLSIVGLGALKLRRAWVGLRVVGRNFLKIVRLLPGAIGAAATALVSFATGPIALVAAAVTGLSLTFKALYDDAREWFGLLEKPVDTSTLQGIEERLKQTRAIQKKLIESAREQGTIYDESEQKFLKAIQSQIDKLEELKRARDKSFGTGELLIRPSATGGEDLFSGLPGEGPEVTVPFAPGQAPAATPTDGADQVKQTEDRKTEFVKKGILDRIQATKDQIAVLNALEAGKTEKEIEFLERRQSINKGFRDAELIKDKTLKDLEVQKLRQQKQLLAEEEKKYIAEKAELKAEEREQEEELALALQEMDEETRALLTEKEKEELQEKLESKRKIEADYVKQKVLADQGRRKQFIQDERQHGAAIANLKKFYNSEEVQGFKSTSGQLMALQDSRHKRMRAVGKAAAHINAAIATYEGAIKAYTAMAGIPIIGPALGASAAALLVAYGVEQQERIASAAGGGLIPNTGAVKGLGGRRDRIPTMTQPGELIVPEPLVPSFTQAVGRPYASDIDEDEDVPVIELAFEDEVAEVLTAKQVEGRDLGIDRSF